MAEVAMAMAKSPEGGTQYLNTLRQQELEQARIQQAARQLQLNIAKNPAEIAHLQAGSVEGQKQLKSYEQQLDIERKQKELQYQKELEVAQIEARYKMAQRLDAEERAARAAKGLPQSPAAATERRQWIVGPQPGTEAH